ncbi:MAG: helix-turn-helix transcriptional regulator [Anaerolineae bacterium]
MPIRGRRGTVGLRREEVAALAGVSVSWYTRLEQGHLIGVSPEVVESLARVFRMSAAEKTYFHVLAREQLPVEHHPLPLEVPPHLKQLLDAIPLYPACVINPFWDVLAWNDAFSRVFGDYALRTGRERNTIWRLFVDPTWRTLIENWEYEAYKTVMIFRYSTHRFINEAWFKAFIEDLSLCSHEFATWWGMQSVRFKHDERKVICHPQVGKLALLPTTLQVVEGQDLRVVVDIPQPEFDTLQKLHDLNTRRSS